MTTDIMNNTMALVQRYGDQAKLQQMRNLFNEIVAEIDTKIIKEAAKRPLSSEETTFLLTYNNKRRRTCEIDKPVKKPRISTIPSITLVSKIPIVEEDNDENIVVKTEPLSIEHKLEKLHIDQL